MSLKDGKEHFSDETTRGYFACKALPAGPTGVVSPSVV